VAFLYVRRDLVEGLESTVTGWFGRVDPFAYRIDLLDWSSSARRFEGGAPTVPNAYGARAGLELLAKVGAPAIGEQVAALTARFIAAMRAAGVALATPEAPDRHGPLVVVRSTDPQELLRRLDARGIVASARGQGLRVAFHAYNTNDDVDAVVAALAAEAPLLARAQAGAQVG
jgi:selenocysteine lyase/cysteine desulfurase